LAKPRRPSRPRKKKGHRSKFETEVEILLAKLPGLSYEYEKDRFPYTITARYTPDWTLTVDGRTIILEAKGRFDYEERRKILGIFEANPSIDLRMVFMRDQKLTKVSKMKYSTWCEKHGIKYSIYPELPL
jgi:hypothetical protein